jgi:hypothetical protein
MGKPRVGKSTVATILGDLLQLKWGDTSDVIYKTIATRKGTTVDKLKEIPKEELRPELIEVGNYLCDQSPIALSYGLIKGGTSIVCGIRRKKEFNCLLTKLEALQVPYTTIFVKNKNVPDIKDNLEVTEDDCSIVINNDSGLSDLKNDLVYIFKKID